MLELKFIGDGLQQALVNMKTWIYIAAFHLEKQNPNALSRELLPESELNSK